MKISHDVIKGLARAARSQGVAEELDGPEDQKIQAFYLEDFTVSFLQGERPSLYGVSFEALGKEFTILANLELMMSLPKEEENEDEIYEISDPDVVAHLEDYLRWRTIALEKFNI